jgi:PTS system nitrogen regulatory IIA component
MKVVDLLRNSSVLIQPTLHAQCADDALTELAAFLAEHHPEVTPAEVAEALAARERLGSTAVGDGLAIPHAKLASAETLMACFGRSETGIRFAAPDGRPRSRCRISSS